MQIRRVNVLIGPNRWSRRPALEAVVDVGSDSLDTEAAARLVARFAEWFPDRSPVAGEITSQKSAAEQIAVAVQLAASELQFRAADTPVGPLFLRAIDDKRSFQIAFEMEEPIVARGCLDEGLVAVAAALADQPYDVAEAVRKLHDVANRICIGPSTGTIVQAAVRRGIPYRRLDDNSLILLGHGCRQHRIRMAVTDRTGAIAQDIAQDKEVTKDLLRSMGLPVPEGRAVVDAADAWLAANEIGLPVVVKPRNANHGRGVSINLSTQEQVERAFEAAVPEGDGVLVESFARGSEHRLLVIDGRMVAASRAEPEEVVGDGRSTVRELVEAVNRDPRRGEDWASPLCIIELDAVAVITLARQGFTVDSVPPAGANVLIHHNGEFLTDVTDVVHPETAAIASLAARVVGLNIAGIDLIVRDISKAPRPQGLRIIEVNAGPGLRMHFQPQYGKPRPVGEWIVSSMFAPGETGRVPIAAVSGAEATATTRLLRELIARKYPHVGVADALGTLVGSQSLHRKGSANAPAQHSVLLHPDSEAALFAIDAASVAKEGLGFDLCQFAVVGEATSPAERDAAEVILSTVEPSGGTVVVDVERLAQFETLRQREAGGLILTSLQADSSIAATHRKSGGRVVTLVDGEIVVEVAAGRTPLGKLEAFAKLVSAEKPTPPQAVLSAVAAALALGLTTDEFQMRFTAA